MDNIKKTKIVATLGPATQTRERIKGLIENGVNVFRLNFSHGSHDYHNTSIENIRKVEKENGFNVSILGDLCGPRIRVGDIQGKIEIQKGETYRICSQDDFFEIKNPENLIPISYESIYRDLEVDERIYIADGTKLLKVTKKEDGKLFAIALTPGEISARKGVNFPDSNLLLHSPSAKDMDDLEFILSKDIDWVALSFVRNHKDIEPLKKKFEEYGKNLPVIAKIEKNQAIEDIHRITEEFDGIMVARGDLGIEIDIEKVPRIQRDLIQIAKSYTKPVIVATQMLESMTHNPVPTRAEVSDVGNAIDNGVDAIMLSGETAIGKYPVEAVELMTKICREVESDYHSQPVKIKESVTEAIAEAIFHISKDIKINAIVTSTLSGSTAANISSKHPNQKIYAFSPRENTVKKLNLYRGTYPALMEFTESSEEYLHVIRNFILKNRLLKKGDKYIFTAGMPFGKSASTNMLQIEEI